MKLVRARALPSVKRRARWSAVGRYGHEARYKYHALYSFEDEQAPGVHIGTDDSLIEEVNYKRLT